MAGVPLGRMIEPEEVAELVLYLASPAASGMTGQTVNLCGGQTMD
jgi:NAD(P)-dependent dehydrogenase (short-subunit alcohol dehydrogenase family)